MGGVEGDRSWRQEVPDFDDLADLEFARGVRTVSTVIPGRVGAGQTEKGPESMPAKRPPMPAISFSSSEFRRNRCRWLAAEGLTWHTPPIPF